MFVEATIELQASNFFDCETVVFRVISLIALTTWRHIVKDYGRIVPRCALDI